MTTDVAPALVGHLHPPDVEHPAAGIEGLPEIPVAEWCDEAEYIRCHRVICTRKSG